VNVIGKGQISQPCLWIRYVTFTSSDWIGLSLDPMRSMDFHDESLDLEAVRRTDIESVMTS
jgi:hypothetical protein